MPHRPFQPALRRVKVCWIALTLAAALPGVGAAAQEQAGAALFKQHCAACHLADGGGIPGLAPPLKGQHWQKLLKNATYLPRVLAFGLSGPIRVGEATYNSAMPAQVQLSDDQLALVINFVAAGLNASELPPDWRPYQSADVTGLRAGKHGSNEQSQLRKQILAP